MRPVVSKDACCSLISLDVALICFASPVPKSLDLIGVSASNCDGGCSPNVKTVCVVQGGLLFPA